MRLIKWLPPGVALLLVVTAAVSTALPPVGRDSGSSGFHTNTPDLGTVFDGNDLLMFVTNQGSWAFDMLIGDAGLEWPKESGKHAIFASGLWAGAKVNGEVRVTVGEFSQEWAAGPMVGMEPPFTGEAMDPTETDPTWKVLKLDAGDTADTNDDWAAWKALGERTDISGPPLDDEGNPKVVGDQALWSVYNDAVAGKHTNDAGFSAPLGLEVRQYTFGFNRTGALGKTIFLDFEFENKGANLLEEMYVSLWFDPDLGGFTDDFVGSDTDLSLGFCYNATNTDAQYGSNVPAIGCDFFLGPLVDGTPLGMTSFNKYINGTDPSSPAETYNYMQGLTAAGEDQDCLGNATTDPSAITKFVLSSDPQTGGPCLDSDPADRRFMMTTGPISMAPGETQRVVAAIILGGEVNKGDRLSNVGLLKFFDGSAQNAFDRNFEVPSPPPVPELSVTEDDRSVILSWGDVSKLGYEEAGYAFEGYNIYQGETLTGPFKRLATYDEVNNVATILDKVFNPDLGAIEQIVVQKGSDSGISHSFEVTADAVRGGGLNNGTTYYFAVTAYAFGADAPDGERTLENPFEGATVAVIPQRLVPGIDASGAEVASVEYRQADAELPPATDVVEATVVSRPKITGHDYRVFFRTLDEPRDVVIDGQTFTIQQTWGIEDLATSEIKIDNQVNKTGNDEYLVVDGLQVKVTGVYAPEVQGAAYQNLNSDHRRALSWVNWGGRYNRGSVDTGCNWSGSTFAESAEQAAGCGAEVRPDRFGTVELRFVADAAADGQKAYRYFRRQLGADNSGSPAVGRGYIYADFADVPFKAVKIVGAVETQLTVMFTERQYTDDAGVPAAEQPASQDGTWMPSDEGDGGREYLNILDLPYSDDPSTYPGLMADGVFFDGAQDVMYGAWLRRRAASDIVDEGDKFTITWGNPAAENDSWVISTTGPASVDAQLADIRVVPNPYLTRSSYEPDQFNRVVKFTNLPATCTVRIFTLAGDLVRSMDKDDATTSILEWDLENRFGLPVGSGVYVFHVQAPGIGGHFGKMAVIMEEERIEDF